MQFDQSDPSCTVLLRGATTSAGATGGSPITSISVLSGSINWQRTFKRKAAKNAYIVAQLVCDEGVANSSVITLKAKRVTSTKKTVTATKWLQLLSQQFHD